MTYKGRYTPINPQKYTGDVNNIVYRSMWEKACFKWLDTNLDVVSWSSEEVVVPYYFPIDKQYHRYFVDIRYTTKSGKTFLIEVKPDKETKPPVSKKRTARHITEATTYVKNQCKWQAAERFAKDNGWEFHVWTEHTLYKLNILPKPPKSLKPLKPLRKANKAM